MFLKLIKILSLIRFLCYLDTVKSDVLDDLRREIQNRVFYHAFSNKNYFSSVEYLGKI